MSDFSALNWRAREERVKLIIPIALRDVRGDISTRSLGALVGGLLDVPLKQQGLVGRILVRLAKAGHQAAFRTGERIMTYGHVGERFAWRGTKPAAVDAAEPWSDT